MSNPPTISLTLPPPPSTNKLWVNGVGKARVRSQAYKAWLHATGWLTRAQLVGVPTIRGTFRAEITMPARSRLDLDNSTKPIFDLLQHVQAIRNDSGLREYSVTMAERDDVLVALWDLGGPEQREPWAFAKAEAKAGVVPKTRRASVPKPTAQLVARVRAATGGRC